MLVISSSFQFAARATFRDAVLATFLGFQREELLKFCVAHLRDVFFTWGCHKGCHG